MRVPDADRVLGVLYERRGGYVGVPELAALADLNRGSLVAALRELQEAGQPIELGPAHGYRLGAPALLNAHLIERDLGTRRVGRGVICFHQVGSTNDVAFDAARQDDADGWVVLAESQRAGRGRMGRRWLSSHGENLLMSVLLVDERQRLAHEALTIAAGLAAAEAIEAVCGTACELKWPNDVLLDDGKVCGVLVELRALPTGKPGRAMIIGLGINVNAAPPVEKVNRPAACLSDYAGGALERIELARGVLQRLDEWVGRIERPELGALHDAWVRRCGMLNRRVEVLSDGRSYRGRVLDVSPMEGLILSCDGGATVHLPARTSTLVG